MTDMRDTERLLEVIGEMAEMAKEHVLSSKTISYSDGMPVANEMGTLLQALAELRRRGDTLVRRDDLRHVVPALEAWISEGFTSDTSQMQAILDRLEIALGRVA